ncbi:12663_t:CDS:1, partial [Cetraspora pellucida]
LYLVNRTTMESTHYNHLKRYLENRYLPSTCDNDQQRRLKKK